MQGTIDVDKINQRQAVSRSQQGRQRVPSVKTLRSPLSYCLLSGETQRHALLRHQSEEIKIKM